MARSVFLGLDATADTTRLPSPALWRGFPSRNDIAEGKVDGIYDGDDFVAPGDEDGNDTGGYERYIDTGNTIRTVASNTTAVATGLRGGVLRMSTDATDNDGPVIQRTSANGAGLFLLGNTAGATWPFCFECRIKKSSITNNQAAFFAGLAQVAAAADNGLLDDDAGDIVNSISAIGFRVKQDAGSELDFAYQDSGQTAPTETIANIQAMVAATWIKVGFRYDPQQVAAEKISIYVNNVRQSTYITTALIDATEFPENDAMCVTFGVKNGEATAVDFDIDWWHAMQVYDDSYYAR